ncbi:MAG: GNAT family N-acetyltransferase [Maritimibacter sp.]|nr:GNAT family N-acetyltransferase [Maritimibacter sp.]
MKPMPKLSFTRLTDVAPEAIAAHMSDPRMAAHMPLLSGRAWTADDARAFVAMKETYWTRDGLGHWAFLADGDYAGWGGFQKEGEDWDFGLVLRPDRFGLGLPLSRMALDVARQDPRIACVTFLLPPTRRHLGALARLGATYTGDVDHDGETFRRFRLTTS